MPVLRTRHLERLVAFYRTALGFEVLQHVPAVVAFLALGPLTLQFWQQPGVLREDCAIVLDGPQGGIFQLHARLARFGRHLLTQPAPQLKPWGAWEFVLVDLDGNRLAFMQWADAPA